MINIGNTIILDDTESIHSLPLDVINKCANIIHVNNKNEIAILKLRKRSNLHLFGMPVFRDDKSKLNTYIQDINAVQVPQLEDPHLAEMVEVINNVIAEYTIYVAEELKE